MGWLWVLTSNEEAHAVSSTDASRREALAAALDPTPVVTRHLQCGDYALNWVSEDGDGVERTVALIEHKRKPDLAASLQDTRYVSQAARLEASGVPYVYWVITEAPLFKPEHAVAVESAIVHLSVSYPHTRVMHIASTGAPFVKFMRSMMKYLHETVIAGEGLPEAPLHTVAQERGAKVRLDTQPVVWVETLTVPRGMSRKSAKEVAKRYPSAAALLAEYRKTRQAFEAAEAVEAASSGGKKKKKKRTLDDALDAMLEDVPLQNGKRLGPAASRTIRRTFLADGDV